MSSIRAAYIANMRNARPSRASAAFNSKAFAFATRGFDEIPTTFTWYCNDCDPGERELPLQMLQSGC